MQLYDLLKLIFFALLCLPVVVLGGYFIVRLIRSSVQIQKFDQKEQQNKIKIEEKAIYEEQRKQNFYDDYDRNKGYR